VERMCRLRIGVLIGGLSVEREVSFNSGRTICDHLDSTRYDVIPIFHTKDNKIYLLPWRFLYRGKTTDFIHRLPEEAEFLRWCDLSKTIDFLYIAEHGCFAEDGTLQGLLEVLGVPYFGSGIFASAVCMDKVRQKDFLRMHDIEVPRGIVLTPCQVDSLDEDNDLVVVCMQKAGIEFPCVVKPAHEGSSVGVSVVHDRSELPDALRMACGVSLGRRQDVLVEEKLIGMEFNCTVLVDYKCSKPMPLVPTEIVPDGGQVIFDYEQKYMPGRAFKYTPPRCNGSVIKRIQDTCVKVMRVLGVEWLARIDGFVTEDDRVVIIDPNTLTGTAPSSFFFREAAEHGMGHADVINHLIETKLYQEGVLLDAESYKRKKSLVGVEKMRVAVLFGGDSDEREISLESGRNIVYKLAPAKYHAIPLFVSREMKLYRLSHAILVRNSTKEIASLVTPKMEVAWEDLPRVADFVFIALHGGKGENGSVQGTLEMLNLPYNGSGVLTSSLCIDKHRTLEFLRAKGFTVPEGRLVSCIEWQEKKQVLADELFKQLGSLVVAKPRDGGCSLEVFKSESVAQLAQHLDHLFARGHDSILVEECLGGTELTVGVVGNDEPLALPPSWAVAQSGVLSIEEKFLPGCGENQTPAPLSPAAMTLVKEEVMRAYTALGCQGYARIDCFYQSIGDDAGPGRCAILEVNTLPGMTPATCIFHQAAEIGIKPMDFIDRIVALGLQRRAKGFTVKPVLQHMQKND